MLDRDGSFDGVCVGVGDAVCVCGTVAPDTEGDAVRVKDSRLCVFCWVFVIDAEVVLEADVVIVTNWVSVPVESTVSVKENSLVSVRVREKVRVASLV